MTESFENKSEVNPYDVRAMMEITPAQAREVITSTPLLRDDRYTNMVAESEFIVKVGGEEKEVNPGLFVAVRLATLESMRASKVIDEAGHIDPIAVQAAMAVDSHDLIVGDPLQ